MQITCPHCTRVVESRDINVEQLVAVCHRCNEVFSFASSFPAPAAVTNSQQASKRLVPQPRSIRVENLGHELRFARRWFSPMYLFLLLFACVWDGFLIFWYSAAFLGFGNNGNNPFDWLMLLFPVVHVAVGVGVTYTAFAGLLNTTRITVGNGVLSVRHRPIFWRGPGDIPTADIVQLYVVEKSWSRNNNASYRLHAILKDNRKVTILPAIHDPDEGWFLEQQIETFLGIQDEPVAGEYQ